MDPIKKIASFLSSQLRRTDSSERSRQLPFSSITLDSGVEASVADGLMRGVDAMENVVILDEHLAASSEISDGTAAALTLLPAQLDLAARAGNEALVAAAATSERVTEAMDQAAAAADAAAAALTTANGKNARRRGKVEPAAPEGGWAQGDQWVVENDEGDPIEVRVWNGTAWVPDQILADELLIVGDDGVVRLKDGTVSATTLTADALNFKAATGMSLSAATITSPLVRTAPSGMRIEFNTNGIQSFGGAGEHRSSILPDSDGFSIRGGLRISQAKLGETETWYSVLDQNGLVLLTDIPLGGGVNAHSEGALRSGDLELRRPYRSPGGVGRDGGEIYATAGSGSQQSTRIIMGSKGEGGESAASVILDPPPTTPTQFNQNGQLVIEATYPADIRVRSRFAPSSPDSDKGRLVVEPRTEFQGPVKFPGDTEWIDCTMLDGTVMQGGKPPRARIRDERIQFQWGVSGTGLTANSSRFAFLLPPGIRPTEYRYAVASGNSQKASVMVVVQTDGRVQIRIGDTAPTYVILDAITVPV